MRMPIPARPVFIDLIHFIPPGSGFRPSTREIPCSYPGESIGHCTHPYSFADVGYGCLGLAAGSRARAIRAGVPHERDRRTGFAGDDAAIGTCGGLCFRLAQADCDSKVALYAIFICTTADRHRFFMRNRNNLARTVESRGWLRCIVGRPSLTLGGTDHLPIQIRARWRRLLLLLR